MSRDYCFTAWTQPKFDEANCRYVCWGEEICPTSGKPHWQGFVIFNRTARIPKAKEWIGAGCETHVEIKNGTRDQARDYCMKEGRFVEHGKYEALTVAEMLRKPKSWIIDNEPLMYVRYHRGIEKLQYNKGMKWREVKVHILWGKTGCGKTRKVMEMDSVYKIDPPYSWWDGYEGEEILLIDDYKIGHIQRGMLLNLLDGYRLRLETKGGHTWALWKCVYITSNFNPETWDDAILRRVTSVEALG